MHKWLGFALIIDIIIFDQLSKWAVSEHIIRIGQPIDVFSWIMNAPDRIDHRSVPVTPFFNWVMVWNEGVSFGLFNSGSGHTAIPLIIISLVVSAFFMVWLTRSQHPLQSTGITLVVGGAIGNVIDRIRFGAVMDFLDFHINGFHWPAFNIADSAIVIGVACLLVWSLFYDKPVAVDALDDEDNV